MIGDPGQHIGEPSQRIDIIEFCRGNERRHGRRSLGAALGTGE